MNTPRPWTGTTTWHETADSDDANSVGRDIQCETKLYRLDAGDLRPPRRRGVHHEKIPLFVVYWPTYRQWNVALYIEVPERVTGDRNTWIWRDAIVHFGANGEAYVGYVTPDPTAGRPDWNNTELFTHSHLNEWGDNTATPATVDPHWAFTENPTDARFDAQHQYSQAWEVDGRQIYCQPQLRFRADLVGVGFDSTLAFDGFRYPSWRERRNHIWWTKDLTGIQKDLYMTFPNMYTCVFGYVRLR